ncbi:MAG: tripartite tricarboxylate transporter substrate binding protein [Burkholderiaceae bacterium]|nr:tripartite tricarboxylate transporter substrate binding protein [Burkholderiaceae bacterium]
MKMMRLFVFALASVLSFAASAQSTNYPNRTVRIVVPFAAGGATDIVTRILAQKLTELWGQSVIVENRAGAGGNIGGAEVAKAAPDGYTLLMTSGSVVTANQHIYKNMGFDPGQDLLPITLVASGPQVIVVNPTLPVKTLKELIDLAKSKPGTLNYGHAGIGSQTHLAAENFLYTTGLEIQNIPYKGEGPAITDLVAGQINLATPNLPAAIQFINGGKLRALAVTGKERSPALPNVPTAAETVPGFENTGWFGLMAPAGTPAAIIDRIYRDTAKVLDTTDMRARFFVQGMAPTPLTPKAFATRIQNESARWATVVRDRKITTN